MAESYDDLYKIILAGDAYVGKTNLVYRFVKTGNENSKYRSHCWRLILLKNGTSARR
uniref:Predicted protein n=1 Tax=Hordeum vulgare subsp. vulgare TaxID=112509 RepID=F2DUR7_HORVV|nr:predicted protein [Hordeum vulgare subsp. vulgare]